MAESMVSGSVITPEVRAWLMAELRYPVMATIRSDGFPSLSVVWFDVDPDRDDVIVLNTKAGRVKHRHLQRDPRLSLCFEDGYDYVTLEGRAVLDDDPVRGLQVIQDLARRYDDPPDRFEGQHRITIEMRIERVIQHD
ncbi:MAG TPA: PPOX class F420-dependent oxidoreductase [Candidatus Limnocylindria bacterium]|nr:PPOX class F420-dependent oxidoreductase [Candidatus Limnocylindria bacterium]